MFSLKPRPGSYVVIGGIFVIDNRFEMTSFERQTAILGV